ncbi:MAG: hypothetical protein R2690_01145 [Acidimicrobiales bacterium]
MVPALAGPDDRSDQVDVDRSRIVALAHQVEELVDVAGVGVQDGEVPMAPSAATRRSAEGLAGGYRLLHLPDDVDPSA